MFSYEYVLRFSTGEDELCDFHEFTVETEDDTDNLRGIILAISRDNPQMQFAGLKLMVKEA